jgi:hypothetical protein
MIGREVPAMERPRFQVSIGTIMASVAIVAVVIAGWPHSAIALDALLIWGICHAAFARAWERWRHIDRPLSRREQAATNRRGCLYALAGLAALYAGVKLIREGIRLISGR